jgi:hypothetical protein
MGESFMVVKKSWLEQTGDGHRNNKKTKVVQKKAPISCEIGAQVFNLR